MPRTTVSIQRDTFLINGKLTYSEIKESYPEAHGLLMNARFIQGIFDDKADPGRFARWGKTEYSPEANTNDLIAALPEWHAHGLRAITVGFQGGGPCFTTPNHTIDNNPFGEDGKQIDPAYAARMDRLIRAADEIGMIIIVSYFYQGQILRLKGSRAIRNAVITASRFLRDGGYTNVLIEVANEQNVGNFPERPLIYYPDGMVLLMDLARSESGGIPVGCSGGGGYYNRDIVDASDVILIHGNGCTRQRYYNMIRQIQSWELHRPIVCNEDSQCFSQLGVALRTRTSWGYYNNMTKQEPPADWRITPGEDTFFARRMAEWIGISTAELPLEEQYYLQGLEPHMVDQGRRWIRLASLYPETINYVDFYRNGEFVCTAYDEPFMVNFQTNWMQGPVTVGSDDEEWRAMVQLANGEVIEKRN